MGDKMTSRKETAERNSLARVEDCYVMTDPFFALSHILLVGIASSGWSELQTKGQTTSPPKISVKQTSIFVAVAL